MIFYTSPCPSAWRPLPRPWLPASASAIPRLLLLCLLFMLCLIPAPSPAAAQQQTGNGARPVYKIGPGDIITLNILAGGMEQARSDLVVSDRGEISVPFIGSIKASGLTLKDLEKKIYVPLEKDYFVDPQINIQMKEYHSLSYTISGAVNKPGKYELNFHPTIMDLIAKAGGMARDRGNIAYVLKSGSTMQDKDPVTIDLTRLLNDGDMNQNVLLETGDTVYIPMQTQLDPTRSKIYLEGEIAKPGMIDYQPGLTALSACIMAGGFSKYAAPSRARIIRIKDDSHEIIKINLDKIKDGDDADFPLKPGDRIHIPQTWL